MKTIRSPSARSGYKLAQLCKAANFHPSTVHYYVKIGLLHRPRRVGLGLYLYDDTHLKKLERIRSLRERENLSLLKIMDRLQKEPEIKQQRDTAATRESRTGDTERPQEVRFTQQAELTRKRLLDVAIELFSKKGYEGTTIGEITRALEMSKGSFYLYFKDKRELFIDCIERLTCLIVPEETGEEISGETDYVALQAKRTATFLKSFPSYAGLLNLVKMASMGPDTSLAQEAKQAFAKIVKPILREFRRAAAEGLVREIDEEIFGYAVLGMLENTGYKLMTDPKKDLNECVERLMDMIARGILPPADTHPQAAEPRRPSGEITDVRGERIKVREICFGGKPYLVGRVGEGEIRPDTGKMAFIRVDHMGSECNVEVTMTDGERTVLVQDGNLIVSAASSVGWYAIPFHRVRSISFL